MSFTLSHEHFQRLFPAYIQMDMAGNIVSVGPSLIRLVGEPLTGRPFFETFTVETPRRVTSADGLTDQREVTLMIRSGKTDFRLRGIVARGDDSICLLVGHVPDVNSDEGALKLSMCDFSPADGSLDLLVASHLRKGLLQDAKVLVDELREKSAEADALAHMDPLTSVTNRRGFFRKLEERLAIARADNTPLTVGVIDLDGFKGVNDIFGHAAGDQLLFQCGARVRALAGPNGVVGRLGGDEFGIILPDLGEEREILELGQSICDALAEPFHVKEGVARIGASIGFAAFPQAGNTAETLFERADYALYHSKQQERGRPMVFTSQHERQIRYQSAIEQGLRESADDEFRIVYQPIIRASDGKATGVEALARWTSPILGPIRPDIFIRAAEQNGAVCRLTRILLRKALADARTWPDDIQLSFNLSALDLASPENAALLQAIILDSGFPPERLMFEITETTIMQDFERALECLAMFSSMGVRIALDDFGTGYSSLGYLQKMPIDRLKIDRSFTLGVTTRRGTRRIMHSIISLCTSLDIECVVEGVSNAKQAQILRDMGAPYLQGFHFSRAMTQAQLLRYLSSPEETGDHAGHPDEDVRWIA
ncbi:MAG: putative bifunctional diguanylate cyclase/phosphodiesterase [Hyphomonas sp.]